MLQNIHDRIKGWVAGVIVAILSLSFMLWGVQYYVNSGSADGATVATVNGDKITAKKLEATFQAMKKAQMKQSDKPLTDIENQQLHQIALQNLIMTTLLHQAAVKQGFRVSHDQTRQYIAGIPAFQQSGRFSQSLFQQFLYSSRLSVQEFLAQVNNSLLLQQVNDGIQGGAFVLPSELDKTYGLYYQTRTFDYCSIPSARFISSVRVTDKAIADYYKAHEKAFMSPEKVSLYYIAVSPQDIAKQVTVSDQAIHQYYEDNVAHYQTASGKKRPLSEVRDAIRRILVQQKTDQLLSKQNDQLADLTYTHPDSLEPAAKSLGVSVSSTSPFTKSGAKAGLAQDPKVLAAAFSDEVLQQGENSLPIELKDGSLVVVRVKDHVSSKLLPLKQVSPQIKQKLANQLAEAKAALVASDVESKLQGGASIAELSKQYHLVWKTASHVARTASSVAPEILSSAFELAPSKKYASTVVALQNGDAAVVHLKQLSLASATLANPQQKKALQDAMRSSNGQLDYQFYLLGEKARAKIKIH